MFQSAYQPDYPVRLLGLMSAGLSFRAACGAMNLQRRRAVDYLSRHPDFRRAADLGQMRRAAHWERLLIQQAVNGKDPQAARGVILMLVTTVSEHWSAHGFTADGVRLRHPCRDAQAAERQAARAARLDPRPSKSPAPLSARPAPEPIAA